MAKVFGSIANLSKTAMGAGLLTVPWALKVSGAYTTLIIIFSCMVLQIISLEVLRVPALRRENDDGGGYAGIVKRLWGAKMGGVVEVVQAAGNFGAFVSWLQIVANEVGTISLIVPAMSKVAPFWVWRTGGLWLLVALVVFPLSSLKNMSALRFSSVLGLMCVFYLMSVILAGYLGSKDAVCGGTDLTLFQCSSFSNLIENSTEPSCVNYNVNDLIKGEKPTELFHSLSSCAESCCADYDNAAPETCQRSPWVFSDWSDNFVHIVRSFTVVAFGFINQVQFVSIIREAEDTSKWVTRGVIVGSTLICFLATIFVGLFGYLTFCDATADCILDNFSPFMPAFFLARVLFVVNVLITMPLVLHPVRQALMGIFVTNNDSGTPRSPSPLRENSPLIKSLLNPERSNARTFECSRRGANARLAINVLLIVSGLTIATMFHELNVVVSLIGAFGGGLLMYTIPALMSFKQMTTDRANAGLQSICWITRLKYGGLAIFGAFGIFLSVAGTILAFLPMDVTS